MIQSISDIITNSSSEVFVIKGTEQKNQEIMDIIIGLYKLLNRDIDKDLEMFTAYNDYKDKYYNYSYEKGNLVIQSTSDNSIPYAIMNFIDDLPYLLDDLSDEDIIKHDHLG